MCADATMMGPAKECVGLVCVHRLVLAFELCVRGQPLNGVRASRCECVFVFVCVSLGWKTNG